MFYTIANTFEPNLLLTKRVSNDYFTHQYINYFDKDGFELSFLEQEYYREHGIPLTNILNHRSNHLEWIGGGDERFYIDHSSISQRWGFAGEAREQLDNHRSKFPQLVKYLNLKPKWGIDFALEFYDNQQFLEVVHFEMDYYSYDQAMESKEWFEEKIISTDWEHFVGSLISSKEEWVHLNGMEQNDWKARHWGLERAEITLKV